MPKLKKAQLKLFSAYTKYLLPYWKKETAVLFLSQAGVLLGIVNPYLAKLVIDKAFGNKDLKVFIILALIGGAVFVLNGLADGIKNYLEKQIKIKISFDLNKKIFKHFQKLDLAYFQDKSTGEHLFRISHDIEKTSDFITTTLPQIISTFPKLLFILIIILQLNWPMALFSVGLASTLYLPSYYFSRKMREVWQNLVNQSEDIFKCLNEFFSHIRLAKTFAKEKTEVRDYLKKDINRIRTSMKNVRLEVISGFSISALDKIIIGLITLYGGYQVIQGQMSLGSLTAIMLYIGQLMGLQYGFTGLFQNIALGLISCQRLEEILSEKPKIIESNCAKNVIFNQGKIIFKNVSFGYKENEPILSRISFDTAGANYIGLIGPSGCGKSTILNLILRLYDSWEGEILIDGRNIKDLTFSSLRGQIGITLQEPFLLNATIEKNITYAVAKINREELMEVAKICGVDDFVKSLPDGYQTIIGENACKLSEGQKQKIAIARALIKKPKILILDEAMSSMDSQSEERIIAYLKKIRQISTLIVVSHRLSTIMDMDQVYFLHKPNQILLASPEELLKTNQEFNELFAKQAQDYLR
ncbi:MAG: ABC transporter ATP-binding protein [Candidatus Omnitrophica bacterium]|nr:ABC transporter ATP-binding protein [Candidatus Omnitrophota bacterium]